MNNYALLKNGKITIISNNRSNGYTVRPIDSTFESAEQNNLFTNVSFDDVVVVDSNMVVINSYKK